MAHHDAMDAPVKSRTVSTTDAGADQPRSVDRKAEPFQDLARGARLDDRLDEPKPALALRALEDIDVERSLEELRPSPAR